MTRAVRPVWRAVCCAIELFRGCSSFVGINDDFLTLRRLIAKPVATVNMNQSQQQRIKRRSAPGGAAPATIRLQTDLRSAALTGLLAALLAGVTFGLFSKPASAQEITAEDNQQRVVISDVIVNRSNIFDADAINGNDPQQQTARLIALGVNRFHRTTREAVILREADVSSGDSITVAEVDEIERRLRVLGIFAAVEAKLVTGDDGVELHITTRDNFSIVAGASGSFVGGIGSVGLSFGEGNLLGTGNRLRFNFDRSTSTQNSSSSITFRDLHFFNTLWRADYGLGQTEGGNSFSFQLSDSFRSLGDGRAWSFTVDGTGRFRNFFLNGDTATQVPEDRARVIAQHVWRRGVFERFLRKGVEASFAQSEFSEPLGNQSDEIQIEQPDDTRTFFIGGLLGLDKNDSFRKVQGLDTLTFVQDVRLGSVAEVRLGVNFVDNFNSQAQSRTDPSVSLVLDKAMAAGDNSLLRFSFTGNAVFEETGGRPWNATARLRAYNTGIKNTTLAFNIDYSTGEDGIGLPVQLTLGENNGLRGYDSRQFQGRQRLRTNIEARYFSGWRLSVLDVGLIAFADAGWAAPTSDRSPAINRSAGVGLRLASNALLGSRVFRIDFAVPFDPPEGDNSNPALSASVGQVFRF